MGQYIVKERVKVTVNENGDLVPAGSFYVRVDEQEYSHDLNGDDSGTLIHPCIDSRVAVVSSNDHPPVDHALYNTKHSMHGTDDNSRILSHVDECIGSTFDESMDEFIAQENEALIDSAYIQAAHDHEDQQRLSRSFIAQLPGAAAFIYNSSTYQGSNDLSHDIRLNGLNDDWGMVDFDSNDDVRPADEIQRLTLLDDYSTSLGISFSDISALTTPRLSRSDEASPHDHNLLTLL